MYLHGVVGVFVVEDEGLLDELMVSLQLVDVRFVVDDVLLVVLQVVHLFLQRASNVHGHMTDLLQTHQEQEDAGAPHLKSRIYECLLLIYQDLLNILDNQV